MEPEKPLVSVIIPVYNGELFLNDALESVMKQEYGPLEIIVVDDGSTDATSKIIKSFGRNVNYIFQEKSGVAIARNRGIKIAKGKIIAFLDADDLWPDNKLKNQLPHFHNDPKMEVVFGRVQYMVARQETGGKLAFEKLGAPTVGVNLGSALFRRKVFDGVGLFDQSLAPSEDIDFFMRIRERGVSIFVAEEVALFYRIHHTNLTSDKKMRDAAFIRALKKSIARRKMHGTGIAKLRIEK